MHEMRRKHLPEPYRRLVNAFRYGENLLPVSFITRKLNIYYTLVGNKKATKNMHHRKMNIGISLSRLRTKRIVTLLNDPQVGATLRDVIAAKHFFLLS